jgi:hypothetical protein
MTVALEVEYYDALDHVNGAIPCQARRVAHASDYNIQKEATLHLVLLPSPGPLPRRPASRPSVASRPRPPLTFVKTLTGKTIALEVEPSDYNIQKEPTLHLVLRLYVSMQIFVK